MRIVFHRLAVQEYRKARRWYREKSEEAEQRFVDEINRCVQRIAIDPWPTLPESTYARPGRARLAKQGFWLGEDLRSFQV